MAAYVVMIRDKMRDEDAFQAYAKAAAGARAGHEITPLAFYGAHEVLEGAAAEGVVILQFSDMEAARAWYASPGYSDARKHRNQGSDYRVLMVEGL